MIGLEKVQQKIIDLLKGSSSLSSVAKWFYGEPEPSLTLYPFISVAQVSGPVEPMTVEAHVWTLRYQILIVDRNADNDAAEKSVQEKVEAVVQTLQSNNTLDGLVSSLRFTLLEFDRVRAEDYALAAARLTVEVLKVA